MLTTDLSAVEPINIDGREIDARGQDTQSPAKSIREAATIQQSQANRLLLEHFRCPEEFANLTVNEDLSAGPGYFLFGNDAVCYGRCSTAAPAAKVTDSLHDALQDVKLSASSVQLPFDPAQIVTNLRHERYHTSHGASRSANESSSLIRKLYYLVRPLLSVSMRKHLQRIYLGDWESIPFPHWPVDFTVENIHEQLLTLSLKSNNLARIPFIWFWPNGAKSCTSVTHDVETNIGWDFCAQLMDLDESFGIKSSFQVIPEERYDVPQERLEAMKARGFELNVHDLNHDGNLMTDRDEFMRRVPGINRHGEIFGALGFRSAVLYRHIDWYHALDFAYDMSIPNVAHLDPQRGGCCTVFPFFNGHILELPVTMTQDYSLFHILQDYSIELWKKQIALIRQRNGLMKMIIHPDYIMDETSRGVYAQLLGYVADMRDRGETWIALPAEVNAWWRLRNTLSLINENGTWKIKGAGADKAQIAYAVLVDGKLTYQFDSTE